MCRREYAEERRRDAESPCLEPENITVDAEGK
jgi:hypothetical protein